MFDKIRFIIILAVAGSYMRVGNYASGAMWLERYCMEKNGALRSLGENELDPGEAAFMELGFCYAQLGRYRDAVHVMTHAYDRYTLYARSADCDLDYRERCALCLHAYAAALNEEGKVMYSDRVRHKAQEISQLWGDKPQ